MTESEVKTLELEVNGKTILDPKVEKQWTVEQLINLYNEEQKLIYLFKLNKFLRREPEMVEVAKNLKLVRDSQDYLTIRLSQL